MDLSGWITRRARGLCGLLLLVLSPQAGAVLVTYDLLDLGSGQFRYDYTVSNDGSLAGSAAVEYFQIAFDTALYDETSLTIASAGGLAADWDQVILGSLASLPAYFDAYALGAGIANGANVSGFAVEFTWLGGPGGPGDQDFLILDSTDFSVLETGTTSANQSSSGTVPVPGVLLLLLAGLVFVRGPRPHVMYG